MLIASVFSVYSVLSSVLTGKGLEGWFFCYMELAMHAVGILLNVCFMTAYSLVTMALTGQ